MSDISIYKPYLQSALTYQGGKSRNESGKTQQDVLLKLSSNENLLGGSPMAMQAIRDAVEFIHEYPDGNAQRLCNALAEFYGNAMSPDQFICANSGSECIELLIRAFLEEDLECIVSTPTFMPYVLFAKKMGANVIDIPLEEETFDVQVDTILAAVNDKTRLLFLTNPNNPTGSYIPDVTIEKLLSQLPSHVITVIDEVYYQFADAHDYSEATKWLDLGYNVVGINSFSKAYGMAAMRIGYMYAQPSIASYVNKLSRPFLLSTLSLNGAIAALADTEFITRTKANIAEGKRYLYPELEKLGLKYWPSQGNFILVKPSNPQAFVDKLFDLNVMVRPVDNFGAIGCVRITIGTPKDNKNLIKAISQIL